MTRQFLALCHADSPELEVVHMKDIREIARRLKPRGTALSSTLQLLRRLFERIPRLFTATIILLVATTGARADWCYPLVRTTCVPEASYASVETFGLYNIGTSVMPVPEELAAQGICELSSLARRFVTCKLPKGELLIEVTYYHAPQPKGYCGGVEDAFLRISLNKSEIAVVKGTHGGCVGSQRHDIRISEYEVHHCILRFEEPTQIVPTGDFTAVATICKNTPLP